MSIESFIKICNRVRARGGTGTLLCSTKLNKFYRVGAVYAPEVPPANNDNEKV